MYMRYLLLLLIISACTKYRNRQGSTELIKDGQDSIIYFGDTGPWGSYESISDSSFIRHLEKYLNDTTTYITTGNEDSIVYIFNDSSVYITGQELMNGDVPVRKIQHPCSMFDSNCAGCKIISAWDSVKYYIH